MQPETKLKIKIFKILKTIEGLWFVKVQQVGIRGTPDVLLCYKGRFYAFELKKDSRARASAIQLYNIEKIQEAGGIGYIVYPGNYLEVLEDCFGYRG